MDKALASLVLLIAAIIAATPAAAAEQCPIDDAAIAQAGGYALAVEAAVSAAPDCERAFRMLEACQLGSSGDVALSAIVRSKCEPLFLGKANPGMKAAYRKKRAGCAKIAKANEGTMYLGLVAVCEARASRNFARKFARGRH
jgi:hypothetical protein